MRHRLDPDSPVPLYWQVAEALRYRIATGELRSGQRLPSLREAAEAWGINMHTVRRAYRKLADGGLVEVRPRSGTVVKERPARQVTGFVPLGVDGGEPMSGTGSSFASRDRPAGLDSWLREVARQGGEQWGLDPRQLGTALGELAWPGPPEGPLAVLECSESQCADLARQVSDRWRVRADPWSLERDGEPPPEAVLLGTYFHYNDIRVRWPHRFPHVRFLATRPDDQVRERLEALRSDGPDPLPVKLWERDEAMARNIAADLVRFLPRERFAVEHAVGAPDDVPGRPSGPILFSPRTWAQLPDEARSRPELVEVRYVFEPRELETLAQELGWASR